MVYLALAIFFIVMLTIAFEWVDKAVASLFGAVLFIILGIIDYDTAIHHIDFQTILLLIGMMILVSTMSKSGMFSWLTVHLAKITKGNPVWIMLIFVSLTWVLSAFLANVTTIVLIVPITIALTSGMGLNPNIYVIAEILFSNIGGAFTLIGDPPNILIGSAADLSFNSFIANLIVPIVIISVVIMLYIFVIYWEDIKPIHKNMKKLFVSNLLIRKIAYKFLDTKLNRTFVIRSLIVISLTFIGFIFSYQLNIQVDIIAISFALILLFLVRKNIVVDDILKEVEWNTILFFVGLFIMVGGLEAVGFLDMISHWILSVTTDFYMILILVLWVSAIVSSLLDNIPFVAVMIPVIFNIQAGITGDYNLDLLWWSLSLGACLGGSGTVIGASSNIVAIDIAKKHGYNISFFDYFKIGFPVTVISMVISSFYLLSRAGFF